MLFLQRRNFYYPLRNIRWSTFSINQRPRGFIVAHKDANEIILPAVINLLYLTEKEEREKKTSDTQCFCTSNPFSNC